MFRTVALTLALLTIAVPSFADSFHVTAVTCQNCFSPPNLPVHTIDAVLTVIPGTGTFWDAFFQAPIPGSGLLEVTHIDGLIDGIHPMTLMVGNQGDGRSWVFPGGQPGLLWFNIAGFDMRVTLEAVIGFVDRDAAPQKGSRKSAGRSSLEMSANDRRFLKSLRISADEPTTEKEVE